MRRIDRRAASRHRYGDRRVPDPRDSRDKGDDVNGSRLGAAALALLGGCPSAQAADGAESASAVPPFYCERAYTNHAWGYQHRGVYVDRDGGVFSFRHEGNDQVLLRVPADSLTEQALLARYAPGRAPAGRVDAAEMAERYAQVLQARAGTLSPRQHRRADAGATLRRCFLPDEAGIYRPVVLRQTGDWEFENTAPAARELSRWLDSLALRAGLQSPY